MGSAKKKKRVTAAKEDKRQANDGTGTSAHGNTGRREDVSFVRLGLHGTPQRVHSRSRSCHIKPGVVSGEERHLSRDSETCEPGPRAAQEPSEIIGRRRGYIEEKRLVTYLASDKSRGLSTVAVA